MQEKFSIRFLSKPIHKISITVDTAKPRVNNKQTRFLNYNLKSDC